MRRGKFIVIDGTDGTGKATQGDSLIKRLNSEGHQSFLEDFPRYGRRSAMLVEKYLRGEFGTAEELGAYLPSMFYAFDRKCAAPVIEKALASGINIISNRYVSANMGHESGKIDDLKERDEFLKWLEDLEYNQFKIPRPDLQILLYADPEIAQARVDKKGHREYVGGTKRDIHEKDINHLRKSSEAFLYCAKKFNWRVVNDNGRTPKEIHEEIYQIAKSCIDDI